MTKNKNNTLDKKALEARRAYQRNWYRNNKDKVKQYQANYWAKKAKENA